MVSLKTASNCFHNKKMDQNHKKQAHPIGEGFKHFILK
jgi:hypothetical protein